MERSTVAIMRLGLNIVATGAHTAGWRMPAAQADAAMDIRTWKAIVRAAEEPGEDAGRSPASWASHITSDPFRDRIAIPVRLRALSMTGRTGEGQRGSEQHHQGARPEEQ